jgi:hypothetical protein
MALFKLPTTRKREQQLEDLRTAIDRLKDHIDWMHGTLQHILTRGVPADTLPAGQVISNAYANAPNVEIYKGIFGESRPIKQQPSKLGIGSTLCQQVHFSLDEYRFWIAQLGLEPRLHRKDWEYFYVSQALWDRDLLAAGKRGLGFAVGHEPMPALFAKYGCEVVATDQAPEAAVKWGWSQSGQHTGVLSELERPSICPTEQFYQRVSFRNVDMNNIPDDLTDFDFCWSICSFEHLGSLEHGINFVENSMRTLKSGGTAIHTTEFNLSSNHDTIESENLSIYRRRDVEAMANRLTNLGYSVAPLDLEPRMGFVETVIDLPPYRHSPHLRLRIDKYDCTSVGIIITKP